MLVILHSENRQIVLFLSYFKIFSVLTSPARARATKQARMRTFMAIKSCEWGNEETVYYLSI